MDLLLGTVLILAGVALGIWAFLSSPASGPRRSRVKSDEQKRDDVKQD